MYHSITAAAAVVNSASKAAVYYWEGEKKLFSYECCQKKLKTRTLASYEFPRTSVRVYEVRVLSLVLTYVHVYTHSTNLLVIYSLLMNNNKHNIRDPGTPAGTPGQLLLVSGAGDSS